MQREFAPVAPGRMIEIPDIGVDMVIPAGAEHDADGVAPRLQVRRDIVDDITGAEIIIRHDRIEHMVADLPAVQPHVLDRRT